MPTGGLLSDKERALVRDAKNLMPERFRSTATDNRILQFIEIVVADINYFPPFTSFTVDGLPTPILPIVRFGASFYAQIFQQMCATLDDFDWTDQGVTVRIDQTAKINTSLPNITKTYERMIQNFKKTQIFAVGGRGLGTPRFQSQLGQFLKISLGSSFLWNTF